MPYPSHFTYTPPTIIQPRRNPRAGAPALPWTPTDAVLAPAPALWFDAQDIDPTTTLGTPISLWSDKSGNSRHAYPYQAAPTYNDLARSVHFDTGLSLTANVPPGTFAAGFAVFIVAQKTTGTLPYGYETLINRSGPVYYNFPGPFEVYNQNRSYGNGAGAQSLDNIGTDIRNLTTQSLLSYQSDTLSWIEHLNGTSITTYPLASLTAYFGNITATTYADASSAIIIGTRPDQVTAFHGHIYEIVIYPRALTGPERQAVEGYLAHRWNLAASLPTGHPYQFVPPTL